MCSGRRRGVGSVAAAKLEVCEARPPRCSTTICALVSAAPWRLHVDFLLRRATHRGSAQDGAPGALQVAVWCLRCAVVRYRGARFRLAPSMRPQGAVWPTDQLTVSQMSDHGTMGWVRLPRRVERAEESSPMVRQ
jgi:hypothetical protein